MQQIFFWRRFINIAMNDRIHRIGLVGATPPINLHKSKSAGNKKQKAIYLLIEIRYNIIKVNNYVYIKALLCKYG